MNEECYESYIFYCVHCRRKALWDAIERHAIYSCVCNARHFKRIPITEAHRAFYDAFEDKDRRDEKQGEKHVRQLLTDIATILVMTLVTIIIVFLSIIVAFCDTCR